MMDIPFCSTPVPLNGTEVLVKLSNLLVPEGGPSPAWHRQVLDAFEDVAIMSTGPAPVDDVLRVIGKHLCDLLGMSRCSVFVRREDGLFQGRVGYCADGEPIDAGVRRLVSGVRGDGFTAEILSSVSPVVVEDTAKDERPLRRVMRVWGIRDMLGVPLVVDSEVVGIIYIDNQGAGHRYTPQDIHVAQTFASITSLILRKAWLYGQLRQHADEVERERSALTVVESVRTDVDRAITAGAGVGQVLAILAHRLGRPVVLYDSRLRVADWSAPPSWKDRPCPGLTKELARTTWVRDMVDALSQSAGAVVTRVTPSYPHRGMFSRLSMEGGTLGYVEICELGRPFDLVDRRVVANVSAALSVAVVEARRSADWRRARLSDLMTELVRSRPDECAIREALEDAGLCNTGPFGCIYVRLSPETGAENSTTPRVRREALLSIVESKAASTSGLELVASTSTDDADVILYRVAPSTVGMEAQPAVADIVSRALPHLVQMLEVRNVVVSGLCTNLLDVSAAVQDSSSVADALAAASPVPAVHDLDAFPLLQLLYQRDGLAGATRYARRLLQPLKEYDVRHGGALIDTLNAFVSAQANIKATALALGVHENTIRYRLARVRDLSTIDPTDFDDLIRVRTAFQLQALAGGTQSARALRAIH